MNILVTYNWIKEYLKTDLAAEDFAKELSLRSMSVESLTNLKELYDQMVIGEVKELKAHPDADKLKIAITDVGKDTVEIVCGGRNLAEGMKVLVALPGAKVRWHGEGDLVTLEKAKIRGVESHGMICAPSEVGFEKAPCPEGGIWDLSEMTTAQPGTAFVEALDLDDVLFDIEVTSNRVDSMSIVGLAREGAASVEGEATIEWPEMPAGGSGKELTVKVEDPDLCPRYMAVVIDGVKVGPSPTWLQTKLLLSGHRPINNIVDITNYVLHEFGQPLHAFDYEKLDSNTIIVRRAKGKEKILALDEQEYELSENNLVIADAKEPVAVAGVMGGEPTGTTAGTTTIVFEAAAFDPVSVRRTSRELNLYSDSQLLFEKGLSTQLPQYALARAIELTLEIAGGEIASEIIDVRDKEYEPLRFRMRPQRIRERIGVEISNEEIEKILTSLGFELEANDNEYEVTVPFWRDHDIENEIDFTEEVARIFGFHNIPGVLPQSPPPSDIPDDTLEWENWLKHQLAGAGYTEFYGYSFVGAEDLARYDLDPKEAVQLFNPLSSDLTHMRTSLMPSLLKDIEMNQGEVPVGQVFELSSIYTMKKDDVPVETSELVIAHFGITDAEAAFLSIKGALELIGDKTGLDVAFERIDDEVRWHPTRSAKVVINGEDVGFLGQVAPTYQNAFGIKKEVVAAQIDIEKVVPMMEITHRYEPIPDYPAVMRDLALAVEERTAFFEIVATIKEQSPLVESVKLVEVYRGTGVAEGKKSLTLSITLRAPDKTLSSEHADDAMRAIERVLKDRFSAIIR